MNFNMLNQVRALLCTHKIKNVITGATIERSFSPTDRFPRAPINRRDMQYLYNDGGLYYFMDEQTFEQTPLDANSIGDALRFVKENTTCKVLFFKEQVIGVEPPIFVELEVTETEPGFKEILQQEPPNRQL